MILNTYHGSYGEWLAEVAPIRELQKLVKGTPRQYKKFVENTVFADENYFFFDRAKTSGHCSACHKDSPIEKGLVSDQKVKHKANIICPKCKREVSCISDTHYKKEGYAYKLESCKWSIIPESANGYLIFRYVRHVKTFETKDGNIRTREIYRTFWDAKGNKIETAYQSDPFDKGFAWVPYKDPSFGFWNENTTYCLPTNTYVFAYDKLGEITKDTWAKYSGMAEYFRDVLSELPMLQRGWELEYYLQAYKKTPAIEQFAKCGLTNLVYDTIHYSYTNKSYIIAGQNTVLKTLDVNKNMFNFIREKNASFSEVNLIKDFFKTYKRVMTSDEFLMLTKYRCKDFLYEFMQYKSLHKLRLYFDRHEQMGQEIKISDYRDYVRFLQELNVQLNSANLFPKNFKKAHDKRHAELMAMRDKIAQEKREAEEAMYLKLMQDKNLGPTESNTLIAKFPETLEELKKEGEALHHCVGSYASQVAAGETMILFIRKKAEPDKSYFTMEFKNNKIVQVRGSHNADAPSDVMAFARKVAAYLQTQPNLATPAA